MDFLSVEWIRVDEVGFTDRLLCKGKGKAVPLQACSGPEGSRKLRFPDFMTTAQDGGNTPGTHFC